MDCLAPKRFQDTAVSDGDLCGSTPPERWMVSSVFRSQEPGPGFFRNWHLVDSNTRNGCRILGDLETGGCVDGALSDLGVFRSGTERSDLVAKLIARTSVFCHINLPRIGSFFHNILTVVSLFRTNKRVGCRYMSKKKAFRANPFFEKSQLSEGCATFRKQIPANPPPEAAFLKN